MNRFDDLLGNYDNQVVLFDMIVLSIDHDFRFSPGAKAKKNRFLVTMIPCLLISSPMNAFSWVTWL